MRIRIDVNQTLFVEFKNEGEAKATHEDIQGGVITLHGVALKGRIVTTTNSNRTFSSNVVRWLQVCFVCVRALAYKFK